MNIKKIIVVLCLLAISFLSNAQKLEKGTWLVGGSMSYVNAFGGDTFLGDLTGAKMLSKNLALGAGIVYYSSSDFALIGTQARYFFNNEKSSKVFLLGNLGVDTSFGNARYVGGVGLANFLNDNVSIDITGTYGNTIKFSANDIYFTTHVIALQVGLQIYLPKKK